jgi:glycosyltransferase involved in cell wall biosynthesis
MPYLVQDGRDALLVPVGDAPAMALAVRRVLTEPDLGHALSLNGRARAAAFDWKVVLPRWELLLRTVLSGTVYA